MLLMLAHVIGAIIFDLDGTLVHSLPGIARALNTILEQHDLPTHPESKVRTFIGNGIVKLVERAAPDDFSQEQVLQLSDAVRLMYAQTWQQGTTAFPGVNETLQELEHQGIKIAVLSNKPHSFCKQITDFIFPEITFSAVIGQQEGIAIKPDPTAALKLAEILRHPPSTLAFVGDSTVDIATARNAGMISVAVTWGYHDIDDLLAYCPVLRVDHISDLPGMLINPTT